jgi:hypothetical protein
MTARQQAWAKRIEVLSGIVFSKLGPYHSESVYQRALAAEIASAPHVDVVVLTEVVLPITYTLPAPKRQTLVVGTCRLDIVLILASGNRVVLELKVLSGVQRKTAQQAAKYKKLLEDSALLFVISFDDSSATVVHI